MSCRFPFGRRCASRYGNTTGGANAALGRDAGDNATTGSYNVFVGANVVGTSADTNTIRIGLPYDSATGAGQNQTFIAGIWGNQVTGTAAQVFVDANGKLGTGTPVAILTADSATVLSPSVIEDQLRAQQAINEELRVANAELRARLARLEARLEGIATAARRR